jgi:hypothetical protein
MGTVAGFEGEIFAQGLRALDRTGFAARAGD